MTVKQGEAEVVAIKALLERDEDFVRSAFSLHASRCSASRGPQHRRAGGARSGDDGGACRGERRVQQRAAWLSEWLLPAVVDYSVRHSGAPGSARPGGAVFDGTIRALSALGEGAGWHLGGDVCAGRFDAEGEGGDGNLVRP